MNRYTTRFLVIILIVACLIPSAVFGKTVDELIADFSSQDDAVRRAAVYELAAVGPSAVPKLAELLWGENMAVNINAIQTLRFMAWRSTAPGKKDLQKQVASALLQQAKNTRLSTAARGTILEILSYVAGKEEFVGINNLTNDKDVAESAEQWLSRVSWFLPDSSSHFGNPYCYMGSKTDFVEALLKEKVPAKGVKQSFRSRTANDYWDMFIDSEAAGRPSSVARYLDVANGFAQLGKSALAFEMFNLLNNRAVNDAERAAALAGLARVGGEKVFPLMYASLSSPRFDIQGIAARYLIENPDPRVTTRLVNMFSKSDVRAREGLVNILGERKGDASLNALIRATKDKSETVRIAAFSALNARTDVSAGRLLPVYHSGLRNAPVTDTDDERKVILQCIARIGSPESVPHLQEALKRGQSEADIYSALASSAKTLADSGRKEEAERLYWQILREANEVNLVRVSAAVLRNLGKTVDTHISNGCIVNWFVLGPIPGREEWIDKDAFNVTEPVDLSASVKIGEKDFNWKYVYLDDPFGMLDFNEVLNKASDSCAYAYAEVISPSAQKVTFGIGSDDDVVVWVNGLEVHRFIGNRGWGANTDKAEVQLKEGTNTILCKVLNGLAGWQLSVWLNPGSPLVLE